MTLLLSCYRLLAFFGDVCRLYYAAIRLILCYYWCVVVCCFATVVKLDLRQPFVWTPPRPEGTPPPRPPLPRQSFGTYSLETKSFSGAYLQHNSSYSCCVFVQTEDSKARRGVCVVSVADVCSIRIGSGATNISKHTTGAGQQQ